MCTTSKWTTLRRRKRPQKMNASSENLSGSSTSVQTLSVNGALLETEGCDTQNCKCPFRAQDIRKMTEVACNNDNSFIELNKSCLTSGFGKTPQAQQAISEWCEKNTEARNVLHNKFKELKSSMNADDNEKEAFRANPQGWKPPPYEIEQADTQ